MYQLTITNRQAEIIIDALNEHNEQLKRQQFDTKEECAEVNWLIWEIACSEILDMNVTAETMDEAERQPYTNPNDETDMAVCCSSCHRINDFPSTFCPFCGKRMIE